MNDHVEVCPLSRRENVSTRIPSITDRPSLSPPSFTRIANSFPCSQPAHGGQRYGLTLFHLILGMMRTRPMRRRHAVHDGPSPRGDHS